MADIVLNIDALQALREARGWNQQALAQQAGIDPSVISRLERGLQDDLRASVLVAIARALHIPVDRLLLEPVVWRSLDADLTAAIATLDQLSPAQQRHVAALLRAYVVNLPE